MNAADKNLETKQRLLEAAGEVFAEQGFRNATVREICKRAGVNVAAVNYHFREKKSLYSAVLQHLANVAIRKYPPTLGLEGEATAEERLAAFVKSFLFRMLDEGRPAWHGRLMAREMAEPTPVFDELAETICRPLHGLLVSIVREILGDTAVEEEVRLSAASIIGQCLFYYHSRPVIAKLMPEQQYGKEDIERLAEHITKFSLRALKAKENGVLARTT